MLDRLGVEQIFIDKVSGKEEAIDTTTPTGKFMLTVLAQWQNWSGNICFNDNERELR